MLATRRTPTPRLLIKDHKPEIDGKYSTHLLIPATNFTQYFAKISLLAIKAILMATNNERILVIDHAETLASAGSVFSSNLDGR